ncbi:MAG: ribonuclease R [Planktomarina sp.]
MSKLPSRTQIMDFIRDNPGKSTKRDISKAFGLKGAAKVELKRLLKDMGDAGEISKRKRRFADPNELPPVSVLTVSAPDAAGDIFAQPVEWGGDGARPNVLVLPRDGDPALGKGDRILARLTKVDGEDHSHTGRIIRRIAHTPSRVLGIFRKGREGGRIVPIDKGTSKEWFIPSADQNDAKDGELVEAEATGPKTRFGLPRARITERLGDPSSGRAISLIAIAQHEIPNDFPQSVLEEAANAKPADQGNRTDLTHLPLITIDPKDARDHDDACCALHDDDPANPGGFRLWVAIADVAAYVTPGSALDTEARTRGNSSYFPDRVVPMLPEALSADLCSLHEGVDRPCIAVEIQITAEGDKKSHRFVRGIMRSPAALSYEEAQAAVDGRPTAKAAPLVDTVLQPLFAAYDALKVARSERGPLELDLPERRIELTDQGDVASIQFKDRFDAHKLIEEFMVLANVCAAESLIAANVPLLFRVHEEPDRAKLDSLRETAGSVGLKLAKGQVLKTHHLNNLLTAAAGTEDAELINLASLRSMTQAYYSPDNLSHFGLALRNYAHFTSPIRRYADLLVHCALITAHKWGDDGLSSEDIERLPSTATQISGTERRSMAAERDTTDRYLARFMADRIGHEFEGRISGIAKFGVFAKLDETGADGLIPMRALGREYFHYDRDTQTLMGSETGQVISMGLRVKVRLEEATPLTGGLIFDLLDIEGRKIAQSRRNRKPLPRGKKKGRKVVRRRK